MGPLGFGFPTRVEPVPSISPLSRLTGKLRVGPSLFLPKSQFLYTRINPTAQFPLHLDERVVHTSIVEGHNAIVLGLATAVAGDPFKIFSTTWTLFWKALCAAYRGSVSTRRLVQLSVKRHYWIIQRGASMTSRPCSSTGKSSRAWLRNCVAQRRSRGAIFCGLLGSPI